MAATVGAVVQEVEQELLSHRRAKREGWYLRTDEAREEIDPQTNEHWYYIPIAFPNGSPDQIDAYELISAVEDQIAERHRAERIRILLVPAI